MRSVVWFLGLLVVTGCSVTTKVVVDLDRPPQRVAALPNPERSRAEREAKVEDILSNPTMPSDLRDSIRDLATEAGNLDRRLRHDAQRRRQDFWQLCGSITREPAPAVTQAEREWLQSQSHVPAATPAVNCVFYQHHYASALFLKRSSESDFYFKYELIALGALVRRIAKNPIAYYQSTSRRPAVRIAAAYDELVRTRAEFTYCIDTSEGCTPAIVKRRATVVFTKNGRQVEALHILDELATRRLFGENVPVRRVAVYSENVQEDLTSVATGEDPGTIREAMEYAMPREIIYGRDGRETLRLDEAALGAVRDAMMNLPPRF